jgi:hypothetical protein
MDQEMAQVPESPSTEQFAYPELTELAWLRMNLATGQDNRILSCTNITCNLMHVAILPKYSS